MYFQLWSFLNTTAFTGWIYLLFMWFKCKTINRKFRIVTGTSWIFFEQICKTTTMDEFRWTGSRNYYPKTIITDEFCKPLSWFQFSFCFRGSSWPEERQTKPHKSREQKFIRSPIAVCKKCAINHAGLSVERKVQPLCLIWRFYSLRSITIVALGCTYGCKI